MNLTAKVQRARPDLKLRLTMWPEDAHEMRIELESASMDLRHYERRARNIKSARLSHGTFLTLETVKGMRLQHGT